MAWANSDRREHLPANWAVLRRRRFKMDGNRCTNVNEYDERCKSPAQECDHIGDRTDHRIEMLRSLCTYHHGKKSGREGGTASGAIKRRNVKKFKRTEKHPGLI